jgi:hypothetical protein
MKSFWQWVKPLDDFLDGHKSKIAKRFKVVNPSTLIPATSSEKIASISQYFAIIITCQICALGAIGYFYKTK